MEVGFIKEVRELFPDFQEFEESKEVPIEGSPFLDKVMSMLPDIQQASMEERVEAAKILLG